jgi:hypothetical protein
MPLDLQIITLIITAQGCGQTCQPEGFDKPYRAIPRGEKNGVSDEEDYSW